MERLSLLILFVVVGSSNVNAGVRRQAVGDVVFRASTRHLHLSVGQNSSTSMIISFTSFNGCVDNNEGNVAKECTNPVPMDAAVLIGKDPKHLDRLVLEHEPAVYYNASAPQNAGNVFMSDFFHHVRVDNLEPDTKYYYKCVNIAYEDLNGEDTRQRGRRDLRQRLLELEHKHNVPEINSFVTAPLRGEGYHKVKLAVIGDVAQLPHSVDALHHLNEERHDISAVLLVGDIAYANCRHPLWDSWFDMLDDFPIFREKALQVAAGNHEVERDDLSHQVFTAYEHRFRMPSTQKAIMGKYPQGGISPAKIPWPLMYDFGNSYYSFVYGPSFNIVLNSYATFEKSSRQYKWFQQQLESMDRDVTPWVTVTLHCPLYNTFNFHKNDIQMSKAREYLEPLMIKHHVNFVLSGHLHAYMRTKNVEHDQVTSTGPIHIILGNGGRNVNTPYRNEQPEDWVDIRDHSTYGYGTFEFINRTHTRYEWVQTGTAHVGDTKLQNAPVFKPERGLKDDDYFTNQYYDAKRQK